MICELDIVLGRDKRHGLVDRTLLVSTDFCSKQFSVNSLFHNEFYPFLLKAVLGKFLA
jgi:hypothetical protein